MAGRYQFLPERPFIPGKGPAGSIAGLGDEVTRFRVGDRVLAMAEQGGYAEEICVDQDQCYLIPEGMPFEAAASMSLAFDTAWFALHERGRLQPGETVLVLGASGAVGNAAIQLAHAKGARVIAAISGQGKREAVVEAGADCVVDLSVENLRDGLREQVYAVTDRNGADVVVDTLGDDFFDAAIRAVAWRGRLIIVGFAAGRIPTIKANYLMLKNIEVSGLQISDYRKRMSETVRRCFTEIFDLYDKGQIKIGAVRGYPLSEFTNALDDLLQRRLTGRAVLRP